MSTTPINGVAGGVPFLALPPAAEVDRPPLVVAWHLMDPPRTEVAMAAALPLRGLAAWRVYLGLPMHGRRMLPGGAEEFFQRMGADAVRNVYGPVVEQAAAEFPAALAELGDRLPVGDRPLGLLGGSVGAGVAQLVMADSNLEVQAAALVSPLVQLRRLVEAGEKLGFAYEWTPEAEVIADRLDFVARVEEIANQDLAVLVVTGQEDDAGIREPAEQLWRLLNTSAAACSLLTVPGMAHAFADEPGIEAAPQTPHAATVDAAVTDWFGRYLQ
jgi:dienelactone hydrolase